MLNYNLIYNNYIIIGIVLIIIIALLIYYYKIIYTNINFEINSVIPTVPKIVTYYNHSLINKYPVNNYEFPEFKKAKSYTVELKSGNSIFIPAGWWHWVFSKENCIAFSHIIHNFHENTVKEKQNLDYKEKNIKFYNHNNYKYIDFIKHSNDSIPFIYNDSNINKITETFLENTLNKINLLASKTKTIVTADKLNNTTITIINGNYKYFNILNSSAYYSYIGMSPLDKTDFTKFINNRWESSAKTAKNDIYLWHSKKNIDTGLHYDITDNLLTLHSGIKQILLFPPSETKYLYNDQLNNIQNYGIFSIN